MHVPNTGAEGEPESLLSVVLYDCVDVKVSMYISVIACSLCVMSFSSGETETRLSKVGYRKRIFC